MRDDYIRCPKCGKMYLKDEYKVEARITTNNYYCIITGYCPNGDKINERVFWTDKIKSVEDMIEEFKEKRKLFKLASD